MRSALGRIGPPSEAEPALLSRDGPRRDLTLLAAGCVQGLYSLCPPTYSPLFQDLGVSSHELHRPQFSPHVAKRLVLVSAPWPDTTWEVPPLPRLLCDRKLPSFPGTCETSGTKPSRGGAALCARLLVGHLSRTRPPFLKTLPGLAMASADPTPAFRTPHSLPCSPRAQPHRPPTAHPLCCLERSPARATRASER